VRYKVYVGNVGYVWYMRRVWYTGIKDMHSTKNMYLMYGMHGLKGYGMYNMYAMCGMYGTYVCMVCIARTACVV